MHRLKHIYHPRFWILVVYQFILLTGIFGCSEGLVLEPAQPFYEQTIELPPAEASDSPPPSTPVEHVQFRVKQAGEFAVKHKTLVWPIFLVIFVLWGFIQLLRWIFVLTTSNPPIS